MTESLLELEAKAANPAKYSVQARAEDSPFAPTSDVAGGGMFWLTMGQWLDEEPPWNAVYPNMRDRYLLKFSREESMIASAKYSMKTRIGTLNYTINGPPRAKKFTQELLNKPGLGDSLSEIVQKLADDLASSDNGAFLELWRPGSPNSDAGSRPVVGFAHLDSRQCWRSYDTDFPVWYTNPITGQIRKIHRSRVVTSSDNPQPVELARGVGFCAVSRALRMTRIIKNMQIYVDEKVSGRFTRAIGAISGITAKQLKAGLDENARNADNKGFVMYKDIPIFAAPGDEVGAEIKLMIEDLASIPDGFVFKDDVELYAYILAFCFGVDAREFWPASQSGATKADATVQNMKARGRGIGNLIQTVEYMIRHAIPETVPFEYDYSDDEQDEMQGRIQAQRQITLSGILRDNGINPLEYRALLIADNIIDGKLLESLDLPATSDDSANMDNADTALDANTGDNADPTDENVGEAAASLKTVKSLGDYRRSLRSLARGYWKGDLGAFDFVDGMTSAVTRHFDQAWDEGAAKYGVEADELTDAEKIRLTLETNTEISYIIGFADFIKANSKTEGGLLRPIFDRVELWVNNYLRIVSLAGAIAAADAKSIWVYGDTVEHCADCSMYAGRVYRNSVWLKFLEPYDAMPHGRGLECKGYNCDCGLKKTSEPVSSGRPPLPVGAKKSMGDITIDIPKILAELHMPKLPPPVYLMITGEHA